MVGNILEISCWAFLILYVVLLKHWGLLLCHTNPFRLTHTEVACALRWLQVKKKSGDNRWNQQLEDWQKSRHLWQSCQTDFCLGLLCSISFASTKKTKSQQNYSVNHRKCNSRKRPECPQINFMCWKPLKSHRCCPRSTFSDKDPLKQQIAAETQEVRLSTTPVSWDK